MTIVLNDAQFSGSFIDGHGEHRLQLVNTVTGSVLWVVLEDSEQAAETLEAFLGGAEKMEGVIQGSSSYEEEVDNTPKSKAPPPQRPLTGAEGSDAKPSREEMLLEMQLYITQDIEDIRSTLGALVGALAQKQAGQARPSGVLGGAAALSKETERRSVLVGAAARTLGGGKIPQGVWLHKEAERGGVRAADGLAGVMGLAGVLGGGAGAGIQPSMALQPDPEPALIRKAPPQEAAAEGEVPVGWEQF